MKHVALKGIGSYLPERILTNDDLSEMVDTNDSWIQERTGIQTRHVAADDESTASLAVEASKRAIEDSGLSVDDIDLIIVATATPDQFFPSVACEVQRDLGIKRHIISFDMSAACTGFTYAWVTASHYIQSGMVKNALVVGSEVLTRVTNWTDRGTCILFGDGAGAVVLSESNEPGILSCHLAADPSLSDILTLPNEPVINEKTLINMNGREVYKFAVSTICELSEHLIEQANLTIDDIDWFVPHQANLRMFKHVSEKLGVPLEKISQDVISHGNTSSASIPLALDRAIKDKKIKKGSKVLIEGFGGGMTWGGLLLQI